MRDEFPDLGLPDGWVCKVELKEDAEGRFSGKAELRQGHDARCVFVLAQQLTRDAVLERLKVRTDQFIAEWQTRRPSSPEK